MPEQRFVTIRLDAFGRLLVVVYAQTEECPIRIISARQATTAERRYYFYFVRFKRNPLIRNKSPKRYELNIINGLSANLTK